MNWNARDPDLGRQRATLALGRRDWGWFDGGRRRGIDREPSRLPWGTTRHVTAHDRYDRTLGIPPRHVAAWPGAAPRLDLQGTMSAGQRANAICDELAAVSYGGPWPDLARSVRVLGEISPAVHGRPEPVQRTIVAAAAHRHHLDAATVEQLARGIGALVAQTTHRAASRALPGAPALNLLAHSRVEVATRLYLARQHVAAAQAESDPDLPRLWLLANGLNHGTPACVLQRVPARSVGPVARIVPTHDDLVGWTGVSSAVRHLRATVTAAAEGRRWLQEVDAPTLDDATLAIGIIALTRPEQATHLALAGPARLGPSWGCSVVPAAPQSVLDLSDTALKAMCDRNGWLLGAPAERTMRELTERDPAGQADDAYLDRRAFRHNPAAPEVRAAQQLVNVAGREALARFAGFSPAPRLSVAEAFQHRFPDRQARRALSAPDPAALLASDPPTVAERGQPVPLSLDLGL